jgi:hypothetical protein
MKNNLYFRLEDVFIFALILLLFTMDVMQIFKNRNLQTQIDELSIIVNEKFLPALILDKTDFNVR